MSKNKTIESGEKLGFGNLLLWNSRMISTSIYVLLAGFLMAYCTDTLGVTPAYISIIMVASKLVDSVTDACAGFIVDRTKTKWGKARPYEVFIILMWVCTWLMFSCPTGLSEIMKCVWISVITMLASVIFNVGFPILMSKYATSASGWSLLVGTFAIAMGGIGILRMIFVKEKYNVDAEKKQEESLKFSDVIELIKGNRYILMLALMGLIFNFVTNMGTIVYYYTWIVGNVGLMSVASLVQMIGIPLAFAFPPLLKRTTVAKLMFAGFVLSAAGYLLNFFAGANIVLLAVAAVMTGTGTVPGSMLIALAVLECAEYNEWKGRPRMEGTMSSVVSLAKKVGAAVGSAGLGVMLTIVGYNGSLDTQSDGTLMGIRLLFSLVPMALYVVVALSLRGYFKLDKQMAQIRKENEERRAAASQENQDAQVQE